MTGTDLQQHIRRRRTAVLMAFDALMLCAAYVLSVIARYGSSLDRSVWLATAGVLGGAVALQWLIGVWARVYLGRVDVASIDETIHLGLTTAGAGLVISIANALTEPPWVGRSIPVSATFLGLFFMLTARALWRSYSDTSQFRRSEEGQRALVIGAGQSGSRLVRTMLERPEVGLVPVALLDDDRWKRKRRHHGIPVLGALADLEDVARSTDAEVIVVAIPSATKDLIKPLADKARGIGLPIKILPPYAESFARKADVRDVRDVNMKDILGRAAIETDLESIAHYVTGKRVLVTGAGGSIGSELCRQIDRFGPAELMMLDRDESALHAVQLSIRNQGLLDSNEVVLNDIRDEHALRQIFEARRPEVVFHAAALKHLPMLEQYPHEAMKTNVLGTAHLLRAADDFGVETFVNVSTDKAADPTSVLGYSKRIAERLTASYDQRSDCTFTSVRFGNVLGSRGSVLHAFTAQIASGGPVTVTHPDITRYFMTVEEAVQLVIQAGALGRNGQVMILDMGTPVKIVDVAEQLIERSGEPIEIVFTGLRDGEKLHEQLFGGREGDERSEHPLISHASVPPLSPDVVLAHDLTSTHLGMLQAFEDWVHLPDPSAEAAAAEIPAPDRSDSGAPVDA